MLTVDAHIDAALNPSRADGSKADLPWMKEGGLDAAFFAVPILQGDPTPDGYANARETALRAVDRIWRMTEDRPRQIGLGLSPEDAYRLEKEGKLTAFIGLENGYAIGTDLSLIAAYHAKGVRYLTLCGEADNAFCDSATDPEDSGDSVISGEGSSPRATASASARASTAGAASPAQTTWAKS
jgi:membrane dipeptidase